MTNLPSDLGGWVTAFLVVVAIIASTWAVIVQKTAENARKDRDDWQKRVELRDVEISDEKEKNKLLQAKNSELADTLSKRPPIDHIMSMLKEERDDASKRHEQLIGEFKTQMDIANRRSEQFHEAQLKALVCIQEGLTAVNTGLNKVAADVQVRSPRSRTRSTDARP